MATTTVQKGGFWWLGLIALLSSFGGCKRETGTGAAKTETLLFKTPFWAKSGSGAVLLRLESPFGDVLLLRRADRLLGPVELANAKESDTDPLGLGAVYRYKPGASELEVARFATWDAATGPVTSMLSEPERGLGKSNVFLDKKNGSIQIGGRTITLKGKVILDIGLSPTGREIAVLSAEGPKRDSVLPFWGGSGASGKHYCEVFDTDSGMVVGKPLLMSFTTEHDAVSRCWSHNGRYLVYAQQYLEFIQIVVIDRERNR